MTRTRPSLFGGWPSGEDITYLCELCGGTVSSTPPHAETCDCGNITVDVEGGRVSADHPDKVWIQRN